jgi:hypothetical protein
MDWDFCYHPAKKRAKKKLQNKIHHKTNKERLKITPTIQETQDKEQHRRATKKHGKLIPKEHEWDYQEELIEDYKYKGVTCRYSGLRYDTVLHRQTHGMAEWMNIQQSNTQYCVHRRTKITNTTLDYNSGNGNFARSPTSLKTFKRALQEMLGCDFCFASRCALRV